MSPEAQKMGKMFRKTKRAQGWSAADIGKIVGAAALTYATGGAAAGILATAVADTYKGKRTNDAIAGNIRKVEKLRKQYLPQLGITKRKGAWYDSQGNRVSQESSMQLLLALGAFGSGG